MTSSNLLEPEWILHLAEPHKSPGRCPVMETVIDLLVNEFPQRAGALTSTVHRTPALPNGYDSWRRKVITIPICIKLRRAEQSSHFPYCIRKQSIPTGTRVRLQTENLSPASGAVGMVKIWFQFVPKTCPHRVIWMYLSVRVKHVQRGCHKSFQIGLLALAFFT